MEVKRYRSITTQRTSHRLQHQMHFKGCERDAGLIRLIVTTTI